ncbi:hypothetical protein Baya_8593 [Bagarius yarrelli]|uniref:Uncharacterized protein n=1 Tax=Bagarius yarrelli TaxID=175774 RepID=A0A556U4D9_BAGYA|nr:hypothetical protein Baya_8593 [Bagarius yarrelli]
MPFVPYRNGKPRLALLTSHSRQRSEQKSAPGEGCLATEPADAHADGVVALEMDGDDVDAQEDVRSRDYSSERFNNETTESHIRAKSQAAADYSSPERRHS